MFLEMANDIGTYVAVTSEYALQLANDGVLLMVFIRFWRDDQLYRFFLERTCHVQDQTRAEVCLISHIMGAISTTPSLVSRTGSTPQRVSFLDRCQLTKHGLQIPPRFDEFILPSIMHKRSYNVFERIDFFSVIRFMIVSLGDTLKLERVLLSPELCEVISSYRHCSFFENVILFESYLLVKAIRTCLILGFSKKAKSFTFSGGPCAFRS